MASTGNFRIEIDHEHRALLSLLRHRWLTAIALLSLASVMASISCQGKMGGEITQELSETVAVINGQRVPSEKFASFVVLHQKGEEDEGVQIHRNELFREFVIKQLVLQEAEREGVLVNELEVQQQLRNWLPEDQLSSPTLIELARDFLKGQKFIHGRIHPQVQLSLGELQDYYQEHEEEFVVEDGAHILEILVNDPALARQIHGQLRPLEIGTFKKIAKLHSQGARAAQGGDLGIFRRGELPEEFEKVIFRLKPGQFSPVFESSHGYHIFMIEESIRRHTQKFYQVQKEIFDRLTAEKERAALDKYLTQLIENASIQIYDETLKFEW